MQTSNKKLEKIIKYNNVTYMRNTDIDYQYFSSEEKLARFSIEKKIFKSEFIPEENLVYIIKDKHYNSVEIPTLVLLHGLRDNSYDWIERGNILENYLYLIENNRISPFNIVLVDAGYEGRSWYSNFYNMKKYCYEDYFIKELVPYISSISTNKKIGIAGFSMGGYSATKFGLKYDCFTVIGSLAGAINIPRLSFKRKQIPFLKYIYIPKFIFKDPDKLDFLKIFSSFGKNIILNNPYDILKNSNLKEKKLYLSVGDNDIEKYYMLYQWIDFIEYLEKKKFSYTGVLCQDEIHNWEYISREIKNFFIFFSES